jgi:4-hydroxybenzoate polyprenyltransferase
MQKIRDRTRDGAMAEESSTLRAWRAAQEQLGLREPIRSETFPSSLVRSMRLHQWLKNLLLLIPLLLIAARATLDDVLQFTVGLVLLGMLTSGTYLINDIIDREADRLHPRKQARPIAAGLLPLPIAAAVGVALIALAVAGAFLLNRGFAFTLLGYLALTTAYSLLLKRIPMLDVLTIATLFTLRLVAGMTLIEEASSQWLLIFSIFFFSSLALMKRYVEFGAMDEAGLNVLQGRGYASEDRMLVAVFGVSSGVASLVVFALFVTSVTQHPESPYTAPALLWGALAGLSYWVMRMWLLAGRGLMNDDPILYALGDRASLTLAAGVGGFVLAAQLLPL